MKKMMKLSLSMVLIAMVFTGCRTAALFNVQENSIAVYDASKLNMENVEKSIIRAGATLGWNMKKVKEGLIEGTLNLRDHMAQVEIPYDTKNYSIVYKNSSNLKYDASSNTIHSNYNGWIQNLNRAIQTQLGLI